MPTVAILGASHKEDRYSFQAVQSYLNAGYSVLPIHPSGISVLNQMTYTHISQLPTQPDILSLYLNPQRCMDMLEDILACEATYIWLNPGADSDQLENALIEAGAQPIRSCNLVALSIGDPMDIALRLSSATKTNNGQ